MSDTLDLPKLRTHRALHPRRPFPLSDQPPLVDATGTLAGTSASLPSSPADGDMATLVADAANGTVWMFRYRAGSTDANNYRWEFVGGSPMAAVVATQESTASTSLTDLATVGPALTVPRSGMYIVTFHSGYWAGATPNGALVTPVSPTLGAVAANGLRMISVTGGQTYRNGGTLGPVQLSAGETLSLQYAAQVAGTASFDQRRLYLLPVKVA